MRVKRVGHAPRLGSCSRAVIAAASCTLSRVQCDGLSPASRQGSSSVPWRAGGCGSANWVQLESMPNRGATRLFGCCTESQFEFRVDRHLRWPQSCRGAAVAGLGRKTRRRLATKHMGYDAALRLNRRLTEAPSTQSTLVLTIRHCLLSQKASGEPESSCFPRNVVWSLPRSWREE